MLALSTQAFCSLIAHYLFNRLTTLMSVLFLLAVLANVDAVQAQTRSLTGAAYIENFNTLANTGTPAWTNDSTLDGWQAFRALGGPLFTTYAADDGGSTTGRLYSYGSADSTDRALGSLASGTPGQITIGVAFTNNTGSTIRSLSITYTGEQWRVGNTAGDGYIFEYQVGVNNANAGGTWTAASLLNFATPQSSPTNSAINGDTAANRVTLSFTLANLDIPAGTDFTLRWRDADSTSSDHGFGIDDFSLTFAPTAITLAAFNITSFADGTLLEWTTGYEATNLGFRIWREAGGTRALVNPRLIAGSALTSGAHTILQAGETYSWWDRVNSKGAAYWLEDIDLDGSSTWHGPFYANADIPETPDQAPPHRPARTLSQLAGNLSEVDTSRVVERVADAPASIKARPSGTLGAQFVLHDTLAGLGAGLESQPAIKLSIKREGFYRVAATQLFAAGLSRNADPTRLQLIADGREIPMAIAGANGHLSDSSFIEFYGLGLDTLSTDTRVYWLVEGKQPGLRMTRLTPSGIPSSAQSFTQTVERRDRIIYFSGLLNGDKPNFFGDLILSQPLDQRLSLPNLYPATTQQAILDITLQGVTGQAHRVAVQLNNNELGFIDFNGQNQGAARFALAHALLLEGVNTVRLTSLGGANDISLVDNIRISYQHRFVATNNVLNFFAPAGQQFTITNFSTPAIRVFDVTNPDAPVELIGQVQPANAGFTLTVATRGAGVRNLLAIAADQAQPVAGLKANQPSALKQATGGDFVIIAPRSLYPSIELLKQARIQNGYKVMVADIEDIYDEFNFGNKSVAAIRDFLAFAKSHWRTPPRYVLLVGDATYDPRNYLGAGEFDLAPTKFVNTALIETASDDWFSDFNDDGVADLATGRLPVRTKDEAELIIGKVLRTGQAPIPAKALLVADQNDGYDFESASAQVRALLQADFQVDEINRGQIGTITAKTKLSEALQDGRGIVNYVGHASVGLWRGNLLTATEARNLHNDTLPLFIVMACLNGYYMDLTNDSLAESLLKAEAGGAVGVWASSALCLPEQQAHMNRELYQAIVQNQNITLGEATRRAKLAITDTDVRKTWILFGDPTMQVK
jgi:hypothetical protein